MLAITPQQLAWYEDVRPQVEGLGLGTLSWGQRGLYRRIKRMLETQSDLPPGLR